LGELLLRVSKSDDNIDVITHSIDIRYSKCYGKQDQIFG